MNDCDCKTPITDSQWSAWDGTCQWCGGLCSDPCDDDDSIVLGGQGRTAQACIDDSGALVTGVVALVLLFIATLVARWCE
jgi:hypothetical protein